MYARVTLLEIDTLRIDVSVAVDLFRETVLPRLRELDGYEGVYVLTTPEGRALLMTLWSSEEAAEAHAKTGFYAEQLEQFMTLFRSPPGRDRYEVTIVDTPALAAG
jgi:heme-degrading monooxygenase HmoA